MAASDWIKMRDNLGSDPDVIAIAAKTKLDEFGVVGRLHAIWSWLDQHSDDGKNVEVSCAFLDRLTSCSGFCDAMRARKWLSGKDGALSFPGYTRHNGKTAKGRALEAKKKDRERQKTKGDKCPPKKGTNVPTSPGLEKRREEKKDLERERDGWNHPRRPTLAEALTAGSTIGVLPALVDEWWHTREASGWFKGAAGGGTLPVGNNWQADLKTYASRGSQQKLPTHRMEKAQQEFPEPALHRTPLPKL
jgi:hypothetical protein